ncbi:MAG TPA: thioredoxin family protein [Terracidiphilus sp.]|jgi:thiol-disulfide isomerase/thioredoxin|nr:thioredoxin family protein [Terracidiphilus sp.]
MFAISRFAKMGVSVVTAAMVIFAGTGAGIPSVEAQEPPSIVGTSPLPGLAGATGWINSKPLTAKQLKGKVVLVDFWAYSCINCIRAVPYVRAWAEKYKDSGLVVIGVHTPEFEFEGRMANVQKAVQKFGITYPVALDSDHAIWNAFHNQYWPAHYFIDAKGKVRYEHFGEGEYEQSERWIQELLKEANAKPMPASAVSVRGEGVQAAADLREVHSPETYIGYSRAAHFASPGGFEFDKEKLYTAPLHPSINEWGLDGKWVDHLQSAELASEGGRIVFHFHARDLHLVLGPTSNGKQVRFRVTIDGHAPGENHGVDTDAQGNGTVTDYRLYQLVRQKGASGDHVFAIEFLDPGVQAFSFTFG